MSKFFFIIAVLLNDGTMKIQTYVVDTCPDQQAFTEVMNDNADAAGIVQWQATCVAAQ